MPEYNRDMPAACDCQNCRIKRMMTPLWEAPSHPMVALDNTIIDQILIDADKRINRAFELGEG